jgi:hypothetical protein
MPGELPQAISVDGIAQYEDRAVAQEVDLIKRTVLSRMGLDKVCGLKEAQVVLSSGGSCWSRSETLRRCARE